MSFSALVKSQIGHTLGASGISSLIRGICAMQAGIFPPTLNYENPDPAIGIEDAGFRVCRKPEPWPVNTGRPRRFEVNAFGFGGANYVVQLEDGSRRPDQGNPVQRHGFPLKSRGEARGDSLGAEVRFYRAKVDKREFRIAHADGTNEEALLKTILSPYASMLARLMPQERSTLSKRGRLCRRR